jgi:hypothetical protein
VLKMLIRALVMAWILGAPLAAQAQDPFPEYLHGAQSADGFEVHDFSIMADRNFFESPWPTACWEAEIDCTNGLDDDRDQYVDCADPGCWGLLACPGTDSCTNGIDDEGAVGPKDCADPYCQTPVDRTADFRFTLSAGPPSNGWPLAFPHHPFIDMFTGSDAETDNPTTMTLALGASGAEPRLQLLLNNDDVFGISHSVKLGTDSTGTGPGLSLTLPWPASPEQPTAVLSGGTAHGNSVRIESLQGNGGLIDLVASSDGESGGPDHANNHLVLGHDGLSYYANSDDHFFMRFGPDLVLGADPLGFRWTNSIHLSPRPFNDGSVKNIVFPANDGTVAVQARLPLQLGTSGLEDGVISCPDCLTPPDDHLVVLDGPEDYLTMIEVPTASGIEQHVEQGIVDITDHTTLAVEGGGDPLVLTPGAVRGDPDVLSCPTCLTRDQPLRWTEEVTQINCAGASANHPASESSPAPIVPEQGPTLGIPQAFYGGQFGDSNLPALECSYRVPESYEPDDPNLGPRRPIVFSIEGYGYGPPQGCPGNSLSALFDIRLKSYRVGDYLGEAWDIAPLAAIPNTFAIDVPCAFGTSTPWSLAEATLEFEGVEPGELLVFQIRRLTSDPGDTWNGPAFLMNARLTYPVARN